MKTFVLVNFIIELLAGLVFLLVPSLIPDLQTADATSIGLGRMYGGAALSTAYFAFTVWRNFDKQDLVKICLQTLLVFHVGVAIAGEWGYQGGGFADHAVFVIHGILAAITLYFVLKIKK